MAASLMVSQRFAPMFWCQFLSALNDNFIKNALVIIVLFKIGGTLGPALVTLAGTFLVLPLFVFSGLGGEIADKFDKAHVVRNLKFGELPIAAIAAMGFYLSSSTVESYVQIGVVLLFLSLFLFASMAALFGPIKYGILPDQLETRELPRANALFGAATFVAILVGTIVGGLAVSNNGFFGQQQPWAVPAVMMAMAIFGLVSSYFVLPTPAGQPDLAITSNPLASVVRLLQELKTDRRLWNGGLIVSWFWLSGIVALSLLPSLVKEHLGGGEDMVTTGLVAFTFGIATGCGIAAMASRSGPNLALVPIGALLMGVFAFDAAWVSFGMASTQTPISIKSVFSSGDGLRVLFDLFGIAVAAGLYIVPSFSSVQAWAPTERRARVVAAVSILNAAMMTGATLAIGGLQVAGVSVPVLLATLGGANVVVAVIVWAIWGRSGERLVAEPRNAG